MMNENTTIDPIRVIGEFRAVSGAETQVMQALTQLQQPSLLQQGCLNFQIQQDDNDPQNFFVVSQWDSEDSLQDHFESEDVLGFSHKVNEIVESAVVNTLDRLN